MRAAIYTGGGGPEVISIAEVPQPKPGTDQALVRVLASGLNRADLSQRLGNYPAPPGSPANIPGIEFVGIVEETGSDVITVKVGQRVFGLAGGGAQAEFLVNNEHLLVPVPEGLDNIEAASVPESFITAYDALFVQAGLAPGESVLVNAAGGGVGSAAVQLARAAGCFVFGTTRTASKAARLAELGVNEVIDTSQQDFVEVIRQRTGGAGVRVCIDFVGSSIQASNLAALATKGRLVLVGSVGGGQIPVDLSSVNRKRLHIVGTVLRARPLEEKIIATRLLADRVVPMLRNGYVRPVVDRAFPLESLADAHRYMESNVGFGKVVISIS